MELLEKNVGKDLRQRKYPKAMPFVLCNIFFERYCSAGMSGENKFSVKMFKNLVYIIFSNFGALFPSQAQS
jgi:hypothetical protein